MQTSSEEFETLVNTSHRHVFKVELYLGSEMIDETFSQRRYFALVDGSVEFARQAESRTTGTFTFQVIDTNGLDYLDVLSGVEIVPYRGIYLSSGAPEFIKLGTLNISDSKVTRNSTGITVTVSAIDRSDLIRWLPFNQPYKIASGMDYFLAAKAIVDNRAVTFSPSYNFGSSTLTTPAMFLSETADPWRDGVLKLAEAVGCEAYFDQAGTLCIFPVPDPAVRAPVREIVHGQSGVLVTPLNKSSNRTDVFNGVICKAEAPWLLFPVSGQAWDTDPLSRTWRYGPFGEKPKKIGDALATTSAQCDAIAAAELKKIKGVVENIDFQMIADPRMEVGDILYLYDPDVRIDGRLMLDTLKMSLGSAAMTGTVRRQV